MQEIPVTSAANEMVLVSCKRLVASINSVYAFCLQHQQSRHDLLGRNLLPHYKAHPFASNPLLMLFMPVCRDFSGRGLVGELPKDNYIYENLTRMKRLDLSGNELGYGVAPIPNSVHKLLKLEYLCDLCCSRCPRDMACHVI